MDRQILFFDIDGTLLSEKTGQVPESAIQAIKQARANGHIAVINTGRTCNSVPKKIKRIDFDAYLYGCGTHITYEGETLMRHSFTQEQCNKIIKLLDDCQIEAFLEAAEDVYCKREYRMAPMNMVRDSFQTLGLSKTRFIGEEELIFDKFCILTDERSDTDKLIGSLEDIVEFMDRGRGIYECIPRGYSKATAMQQLAEHLGIEMKDTWAFGDSSNDLSMFLAADHAIALGKHDSVLDPYTEYVTDTVENDGIAKAMKHFGLI